MTISVTEPINRAMQRTKLILFKPFNIGKWFVLGFCAFLAECGENGGGNGAFQYPNSGGGRGGPGAGKAPTTQQMIDWLQAHLTPIIVIGIGVLLFVLLLSAIITWLKARGTFMYLDGIVQNRAAIAEPWHEYRQEANSLFLFTFGIGTLGMFLSFGILALGGWIAWPDFKAGRFDRSAITAIIVTGSLLILSTIVFLIINLLVRNFVTPVMYLRRLRIGPAWDVAKTELLSGHVGSVVLFFLMKFLLSLVTGVMAIIVTCATCCVAALPYLGTVILLPLSVFMRCYTLCFIEQFGPQWQFFFYEMAGPRCPNCGFNLQGMPNTGACPHCGAPYANPPPPQWAM